MNALNKDFSHIYIESEVVNYPFANKIINQFPSAEIIEVDNYRDIFLRKGQSFNIQKKSKSLILAFKRSGFIYEGSHFSQDKSIDNFFYNTLSMNCLYDCSYCYLQGMYPSANIVLFLNLPDYFNATKIAINSRLNFSKPLFLSLSYDTDLLAFENIAPYCKNWIRFAHENDNFIGEIRTKSSNFHSISNLDPTDRILLAWTLSPQKVSDTFEHDTPSLRSRISSACKAADKGWTIRLCFDPVIMIEDWKSLYSECIENAFELLSTDQIYDATVGTFRMSSTHLRIARNQRPQHGLLQKEWVVNDGSATMSPEDQHEVASFMTETLSKWLPLNRITIWS